MNEKKIQNAVPQVNVVIVLEDKPVAVTVL
jgi:hypothetical protein